MAALVDTSDENGDAAHRNLFYINSPSGGNPCGAKPIPHQDTYTK
jgi:hypothetical protein